MAVTSLGPNYLDADYMQRDGTDGSGSGSGPDFDDDRDDEYVRGSGSGDGPGQDGKHNLLKKYLKNNISTFNIRYSLSLNLKTEYICIFIHYTLKQSFWHNILLRI